MTQNKAKPMDEQSFVFSTMEDEKGKKLDEMFGMKPSCLKVQPSNCLMPPKFVYYAQKIRDMKVYEDDTWLISFPRTGSHLAQEMVWCIGNDFDYEKARTHFFLRCPLLENSCLLTDETYKDLLEQLGDFFEYTIKMPRPRYIKSHLPWALLPRELREKKPKIIYGTRNPKDTCVSYYHYCRVFHGMKGSFDDFAKLMLQDNVPLSPFWEHILPFWQMKNQENVLFLTYEEMNQDLNAVIKRTAKFLGKNMTDQQIVELSEHLKFSKMATNPSVNMEQFLLDEKARQNDPNYKFIRKGKVGDWVNYMSEDISQRYDEWTKKHLRGTGLNFHTDIINDE